MAAIAALIAAPLAYANIAIYLIVTRGDMGLLFDPERALSLSSPRIELFQFGMLLDSFGFYLLILPVGGYLWARLRDQGGPVIDAAVLSIVIYVMLGIAGTSIQIVALPLLANIHASTEAGLREGSETAWLLTVHIAQRALWWMEGPTFAFWALATGAAMRVQKMPFGGFLMVLGVLYATFFFLAFFGAHEAAELVLLVAILTVPLWLILFGIDRWRNGGR